jgi:hypothetical protein
VNEKLPREIDSADGAAGAAGPAGAERVA